MVDALRAKVETQGPAPGCPRRGRGRRGRQALGDPAEAAPAAEATDVAEGGDES